MAGFQGFVAGFREDLKRYLNCFPFQSDQAGHESHAVLPSDHWLSVEVLGLLTQYPGGLTLAVIETVLLEKWRQEAQRQRRGHFAGSDVSSVVSLASLLQGPARKQHRPRSVELNVIETHLQEGKASSILVQEASYKNEHVKAYLHSNFADERTCSLFKGTRKLRWGNARMLNSKAAKQGPVLLPSANIVGVFEHAEIILSAFPDLRTYTLDEAKALTVNCGDPTVVDGFLVATVKGVEKADDISCHSMQWQSRVWLSASSLTSKEQHMEIAIVLSSEQAALGDLLRHGETLLVRQPAIVCHAGEGGPHYHLQVYPQTLLCVVNDGHADGICLNAANVLSGRPAAVPQRNGGACEDDNPDCGLWIGCVASIAAIASGRGATLEICSVNALGNNRRFLLDIENCSRQVAKDILAIRQGHVLAISEGRDLSPLVYNLSTLPAFLSSLAFSHLPMELAAAEKALESAQTSCDMSPIMSRVVTNNIFHVVIRRIHATCGRPVRDASFGLNDFFDSPPPSKHGSAAARAATPGREDAINEADVAFMEDDVGHLWTCPWCAVECGLAGTLPQLLLDVEIADASGTLVAAAEGEVAEVLLSISVSAYATLGAEAAQQHIAAQLGRHFVVSLCCSWATPQSRLWIAGAYPST